MSFSLISVFVVPAAVHFHAGLSDRLFPTVLSLLSNSISRGTGSFFEPDHDRVQDHGEKKNEREQQYHRLQRSHDQPQDD
jgi:hypothetical protein